MVKPNIPSSEGHAAMKWKAFSVADLQSDTYLTCLNNFHLRLLLHCSDLSEDTAALHIRPGKLLIAIFGAPGWRPKIIFKNG